MMPMARSVDGLVHHLQDGTVSKMFSGMRPPDREQRHRQTNAECVEQQIRATRLVRMPAHISPPLSPHQSPSRFSPFSR